MTRTLTDDERVAALFAVVEDVRRMAQSLAATCERLIDGDEYLYSARAEDVALEAEMIGHLCAPVRMLLAEEERDA